MHPILFHSHGVTIYTYGFFVALAVLISYLLVSRRANVFGIDEGLAGDLVFLLFVAGVIGARLFYVVQHFEDYHTDLWKVFSIAEGGLVWYGGFLVSASAGLIVAMWRRWPILRICDLFAPVIPLAHAIGRIGCFFNGCCYGRETNAPFGLTIPGDNVPRIPIQIFESAALFCLSILLYWLSIKKRKAGELFIIYLILYSALRFLIEFFRGDQTELWFLTPPQWTSLLLFGGALVLYFTTRKNNII